MSSKDVVKAMEEDQVGQEAMPDDRGRYRMQVHEKFSSLWSKACSFRESLGFPQDITVKDQNKVKHLFTVKDKIPLPQKVVLLGDAGVGKTMWVRKAVLDWAEGNFYSQQFSYVFYLNGREISPLTVRSLLQLLSMNWPGCETPIEKSLLQPSRLLFIMDGFDELNFAFEEPFSDLCSDWNQEHPVSFLISSLLRRGMLKKASLVMTMRRAVFHKVRSGLEPYRVVKLKGMPKNVRMKYIYEFFRDSPWAVKAVSCIRNNQRLLKMCRVPKVCWLLCTCLKQQMEKGSDITATNLTATALFTYHVTSLFARVGGHYANLPNETLLRRLCYMAAKGVWNSSHVFYRDDLRKHELTRSDLSVFLDLNILQKDSACERSYVFTYMHVQELFAALFYFLKDRWDPTGELLKPFENVNLLLASHKDEDPIESQKDQDPRKSQKDQDPRKSQKDQDPRKSQKDSNSHLLQMKYFIFGLLNKDRLRELEETFNFAMSLEVKSKLFQWIENLRDRDDSSLRKVLMDLFNYLYETQDAAFVTEAMSYFPKVVVTISKIKYLLIYSFCMKHCQHLKTLKLNITAVSEDNLKLSLIEEIRKQDTHVLTHCWQDLCSVLHTNEQLRELDLCDCHIEEIVMKILNNELRHPNCKLQRLLLRNVVFPDGCQDFFSFLSCNQNLVHLDLKDTSLQDSGTRSLCEALKHPKCTLQELRLQSSDVNSVRCLNLSKTLVRNRSLVFLNLSLNNLTDNGVKLLCEALGHADCYLEKLCLGSCGFTKASCKPLSLALISNKRLTHLCLSDNILGDGGVRLISGALKHPQCALQSLVLQSCHFTQLGNEIIWASLMHNKRLTHLDLGSNRLYDNGVKLLCQVLGDPTCNIQELGLTDCALTTASCVDLASAIVKNPNLCSLDLGNNDLQDMGAQILCDALRHPNSNIQRLGLDSCRLTSACCPDISSCLLNNQKLIKLNLSKNKIGCKGIEILCKVLMSSECQLQLLGFDRVDLNMKSKTLLETVQVSNPHLVIESPCDHNGKERSWWQSF